MNFLNSIFKLNQDGSPAGFKGSRIYLDYASITPIDKAVIKEMNRVMKDPALQANPASLYEEGVIANQMLEESQKTVATFIEAHPDEIIFTSGGTESNRMTIDFVIKFAQGNSENSDNFNLVTSTPHIISTTIEHPSILDYLTELEKNKKIELTLINPNEDGLISVDDVKSAVKQNTILVSVIYVNNEIGTIQPIAEIAKSVKKIAEGQGGNGGKIFVHTDACQALTYLPIRMPTLHVDFMSIDAGKAYGPRGIGALYCKRNPGYNLERPGTLNLPAIAGFAVAVQEIQKSQIKEIERISKLRDSFCQKLLVDDFISVNGTMESGKRIANNLNICIKGIDAEYLVLMLDAMGIAVSSVTSCRNKKEDPYSYVVKAVRGASGDAQGADVSANDCSRSSLRISLGKFNTESDIEIASQKIKKAIQKALTHVL